MPGAAKRNPNVSPKNIQVRTIPRNPLSTSDIEAAKILAVHATGGITVTGPVAISNGMQQPGTKVTNAATLSGGTPGRTQ
jgi:hypothetical protein